VGYTSRSVNCSELSYIRAADTRSRLPGGRHKCSRPALPSSACYRSRGFVEALQEMFLASRPKFVGMAYSILRNKEDAEDAVQDAFLSAYRHLRNFEGRSAFTTWFTRIVLNAALMILRKRTNSRIDSLPEHSTGDELPWTERIPASQPDPEMIYAEVETFQLIDVLLGKMSPLLREAFTMTYYDEMSSVEAGAVLGVSAGTFKTRLLRARQHLVNQAQRSLVVSIRRATHRPFSFAKDSFQKVAARPAEISSTEMAFS